MYLDYSKLEFDINGIPETPDLVLKTLSDETIGVLSGVHNLKLNIKFSEPSELTFDIPAIIDGVENPLYNRVTGRKIIYTKNYGVYVTMKPSRYADGISDVKSVQCYSIEKRLEDKRFFIEEGTFNFWNPVNPSDTVLGRIIEVAPGWSIGYVSESLIGRYRTFEQYDEYLLSFMYDKAPEKYLCVFVFDTYNKTINVYDIDDSSYDQKLKNPLPIYLDFDNLIETLEVEELSDELVTALQPYGADSLDIRDVNPIGTNWIYDLSYFIDNGDISGDLLDRWNEWQLLIKDEQNAYEGFVGLRASSTAKLLALQAKLVDLNGELTDLTNQQSVTIQAIASESTSSGKQTQQEVLDEINKKINSKKAEIAAQEEEIASIQSNIDKNNEEIQKIVDRLSISNFFTDDEYQKLREYLVEDTLTDETFVATDVDTSVSGTSYSINNCSISIQESDITQIDLSSSFSKQLYTLTGGKFSVIGDINLSCDIIRGTVEVSSANSFVLSLYAGEITVSDKTATSGMITISGTLSGMENDISIKLDDGIETLKGSKISFNGSTGTMFMTANVSEYQKYSVQMELYNHAKSLLHSAATATYEFSLESGNFIFEKEFAPFRNKLELGRGIYLNIGRNTIIIPVIIEFELDFEDHSSFSVVFSNRFKRHDTVNKLKDMIEEGYSSGRSFDASKYIYNQTVGQSSAVSEFMNSSLDAAKNSIIAASNQKIRIDGSGIHVGGDSNYQLRIVDNMIAMTDDNWSTAKLAIGLFSSEEVGTYWGVNAGVIGGKLIIGNNLVIENTNDTGVMQFKVDSTGAWLNNSTFVLQKDSGGKIIIDPSYGIVAGSGTLFTTNGTTVIPSFIDEDGDIELDEDGLPSNSNFYLDIRDGSAYFRGTVHSTAGSIGGWTLEDGYLHSGSGSTFVALNASSSENALYAIWAGATSPESAPFYVKRNGDIYAKNGTFGGTLNAVRLDGNLTSGDNGWLIGCGINVGSGNFYVDTSGNVTMKGSINMSNGSITWGTNNSPVRVLYSRYQLSKPTLPYSSYPSSSSSSWHQTLSVAYDLYVSYSYDGGSTWTDAIKTQGVDGEDGRDGVDGSDATVNERNVFNVLTNGGTKFGIFGESTSNTLYINANYIRTGILDADYIELTCGYGGFCKGYGSTGVSRTYGSMMYGSNGRGSEPYFIVTNTGCRMTTESLDFFITNNGIYAAEELTISSDRRMKHSIDYDLSSYEDFFMNLKPTRFMYNHGESGRLHTGFIAQDVESALNSSGLTKSDFAGLVITPVEEVMKDGIEDYKYRLRYGEFISLNTYMIQRLYHRVEEIENKLGL